ncbi:hypothetical protein CH379_016320 [Leptospira ellisii]|uniref:Uncharacterized protein n=1 Tax=Leptospira ellisii TaxID=2023197 RepID=A0A2N0B584_9LEPT|nr:hypothetical protein [Leptospira ellisii]MDV6237199.1 hypothetical protein [Leptospira ellisii]PJZ91676.1 hypothetical protein CH379_17360 [Leptospira ellisii]PKA03492.1 hypothetical protein CH375_16660 [Leptospira ellisii]
MKKIIYSLFKLQDKREYLEELQSGMLYMNTLRTYSNYENVDGEYRGDSYEGIESYFQTDKISITIGDYQVDPSDLSGPVIVSKDSTLSYHAFCMYSLHSGDWKEVAEDKISEFQQSLKLDIRNYSLGQFMLVVTNAGEFLKRVQTAIKNNNLKGKFGLVEYFDETEFHGTFNEEKLGFHKRNIFKHQNEYRILIDFDNGNLGVEKFNIGNITDISRIIKTEEFNSSIKIEFR